MYVDKEGYATMPTISTFIASIMIPGSERSGSITLYRYKENKEPKFYNIISITPPGGVTYRLKQTEVWETVPDDLRQYATNDYFFTAPLQGDAIALFFVGHSYANNPQQLTIVIVNHKNAQMVFNRLINITEINHPTGLVPFSLKGEADGKTIRIKVDGRVLKIQE